MALQRGKPRFHEPFVEYIRIVNVIIYYTYANAHARVRTRYNIINKRDDFLNFIRIIRTI